MVPTHYEPEIWLAYFSEWRITQKYPTAPSEMLMLPWKHNYWFLNPVKKGVVAQKAWYVETPCFTSQQGHLICVRLAVGVLQQNLSSSENL